MNMTNFTVYRLANMAGVASPDAPDSPGARFLEHVQDAVNDLDGHRDGDDTVHEIADAAVPVYTHERWQVFVDLCAYNEDLGDLDGAVNDMTQNAASALYLIAERLATILLDEDPEGDDDDDD